MGNYLTMNRIKASRLSKNGLECVICSVALQPMSKRRTNFPFFCPYCYELYRRLYDSYGRSDFLNERDKWYPEFYRSNKNIYNNK